MSCFPPENYLETETALKLVAKSSTILMPTSETLTQGSLVVTGLCPVSPRSPKSGKPHLQGKPLSV
jgi:hypothetical protein